MCNLSTFKYNIMRSKLFAFTLLLISFSTLVRANVWRVNSSMTTDVSQKLFKTINEANLNASVAAGDTLMIEGSAIQYDGATLTKSLILIGPGYFLTENPQTQANGTPATVQEIDINSTASGSVLEGLTFSNGSSYYTPFVKADNVIITRCYCSHPIQMDDNTKNVSILENYFLRNAVNVGSSYYSFSNVTFKNNYVGNDNGVSLNISTSDEEPRVFSSMDNNIFSGNIIATTTTFRSNIITSSSATVTITSANIQSNLTAGGQLNSVGSGNITYTSSSLFVSATGNSTDGQYQLQTSSPYIGSGFGGTQPGIFGGTQPYVLSGIPPVPSIYEFSADNAANKQTGLPVSIKVKTNL